MKNTYFTQFKIFIALTISVLTNSLSATGVYLENNYGATLNYKTSQALSEGQRVGNNVRVFLGDIDYLPELSVRTTGKGSSYVSYYYDLGYLLKDIKFHQATHPNQDAVITINPSRVKWNVTYNWEKKGSLKPFEYEDFPQKPEPIKEIPQPQPTPQPTPFTPAEITDGNGAHEKEEKLMALNTSTQRLDAIKNGALGPDYAQKAKDICDANYTQAEKLGKINLCSELKRNLIAPVYRIDRRAIKKGIKSPDLAPAIDEIKSSINRLHGALGRYKSRNEAS